MVSGGVWNILWNSSTACAIREYLAFGSSLRVPKVGLANALLVSMIRPLALAIHVSKDLIYLPALLSVLREDKPVVSRIHRSDHLVAILVTSFRQTSTPRVVGSK